MLGPASRSSNSCFEIPMQRSALRSCVLSGVFWYSRQYRPLSPCARSCRWKLSIFRKSFPRSAYVRARLRPASIDGARASIAAAPKNCRRPGDISLQSRRREKQSREQSDQSARVLKRGISDFRRTARVAGAVCLAADDPCKILRSGSA